MGAKEIRNPKTLARFKATPVTANSNQYAPDQITDQRPPSARTPCTDGSSRERVIAGDAGAAGQTVPEVFTPVLQEAAMKAGLACW
jgi:hypothetical protein